MQTATRPTSNGHEAERRAEKAAAIADVLERIHANTETSLDAAEFARGMSTEVRDTVVAITNALLRESNPSHKPFGVPSDRTWDMAVATLEQRARIKADPFAFFGVR